MKNAQYNNQEADVFWSNVNLKGARDFVLVYYY